MRATVARPRPSPAAKQSFLDSTRTLSKPSTKTSTGRNMLRVVEDSIIVSAVCERRSISNNMKASIRFVFHFSLVVLSLLAYILVFSLPLGKHNCNCIYTLFILYNSHSVAKNMGPFVRISTVFASLL